MATLKPEHKIFLVTELAMYGTPTAVAAAFKERFGFEIGRDQVHIYDAGKKRIRERMSEEHVKLFDKVREEWDEEVTTVPLANKRWRLEKMQEMIDELGPKQRRAILQILEQAAKDFGGMYSNRLRVDLSRMSDEELIERAKSAVGGTRP